MSDLAAWLSNRLDEVEALAKSAGSCGDTWTHNEGGGNPHLITGSRSDAYRNSVVVYDEGAPSEAQADHIATFDPAMVLRLVSATRAVLELHEPNPMDDHMRDWYLRFHPEQAGGWCLTCGERPGGPGDCALLEVLSPCPTLRAVAAGWGWVE